jgi:hypothetical protein
VLADDTKSSDKPSRDDPNGQNKKNLKPRNQSDSRKSTINARPAMGVSSNNRKHNDTPPRMQSKVKADSRTVDHRDSKNEDSSSVHVRGKYYPRGLQSIFPDLVKEFYRKIFPQNVDRLFQLLRPLVMRGINH